MFGNFYQNKKVFLTGHTGFKGSWLSLWLKSLGAKVKGYALAPKTKHDFFHVCHVEKDIESEIADIRDFKKLNASLQGFQPDVVFHLAAQPLVRDSYVTPRETFEVNVIGTVNLLDIIQGMDNVKAIVNVTSDKCYENVEKTEGYKESDPMGGHDPYSSSKGCSELVTSAFRDSFFTQTEKLLASGRAGNVIGGGDWSKDRIVVDCMKSLYEERPIAVRNPSAIRPWQHVLEPLSGYLWLASQVGLSDFQKYCSGFNFGPDETRHYSVKEMVEILIDHYGKGEWVDKSDPNAVHEAKLLQLDISKAKQELRWQPVLSTPQSIQYTVEWYKHYKEHKDSIREISESQINEYTRLAKKKKIEWAVGK